MPGIRINICFWYIDDTIVDEIVQLLIQGNYDPVFCKCKDLENLENRLLEGNVDLIISDFDLPDTLRITIEDIHNRIAFHIPLIYLVGERNEKKAAETLKKGVWDYLLKSQFIKLVPTVYSSQKYGKVLKQSKKMEDDLLESESKYLSIFNTVKDGMLIIERETLNILDYNQSIIELFGYDPNWEKNQVLENLAGSTGSLCKNELEDITKGLEDGKSVSFLCQNRKLNGEEFWSENTLSYLEMGSVTQYILVIRDIEQQKIMEESLHKSRVHFQNLAENSPDVIMRFDKEFRHIYVNQTVEEQTGIPLKNFKDKTHKEMGVFPEEMIGFWEKSIEKVFVTGENNTVEFDFNAPDKIISFEWRLFPELNDEGEVQTVLAIARDITDSKTAREKIKKSEERLNLAVEATSLGYWDWNINSNKVFYSPIYFRMLGYSNNELPMEFETWEGLLHEEDREKAVAFLDTNIKKGEITFENEFRLKCKDGSYKWICNRGRVVEFKKNGDPLRLIGTHEDISSRKRADKIQETIFNISTAVNSTKNLDELYEKIHEFLGEIVDTTNCFLAIYHEESNMLTMPFHRDEIDSFEEFPAGKTLTGYVVNTGKSQLIDAKIEAELTKKGLVEPYGSPCVSWLGVPLKADGRIIGVFVVQSYNEDVVYSKEDVSILEFVSDQIALAIERKRDQDNVKESQEKQRRIFESSPDPIMVVDPNGLVIDYNTILLSALNITNEPIIGQKIFYFIHKKYWRAAIQSFKNTWEEGYIKNLEFIVNRADGTSFESEVSTGAIYNNENAPESMVIIFKDISERKEAERKLLEAKEKAEESDRLKTAFLSNMSHEIRTPMNAIVGFSDLLNDDNLSSHDRGEFIAQINMGADNLMHLIDDIIDISKIEAGQIKVNKFECHLNSIIQELIVLFKQNLERLDKSNIELRMDWKYPSANLVIKSDPFRVKQIISNLINNAIKFTDEGFIEIGVEEVEGFIRISVKDTGIGIAAEKLEIIFARFMQGHKSDTRLYGGTGLGLAISKNLTELLGGEIGVLSKQDKGSEFWFTLPHDKVESPSIKKKESDKKILKDWAKKTILIAEDDQSNFNLLKEALKQTNVDIIWAKDGRETIDLFNTHKDKLNLVIMDIRMPEMDGYECTRIIKNERPKLPVVAQTAYAMSGEIEDSKAAGCDDYITKPLQINTLIDTLGAFL